MITLLQTPCPSDFLVSNQRAGKKGKCSVTNKSQMFLIYHGDNTVYPASLMMNMMIQYALHQKQLGIVLSLL